MIQLEHKIGDGACWLRVTGHAPGEAGNNLACAGASAIVYALVGYLENRPERITQLEKTLASGYADITCRGEVEEAFYMAVIGLLQIQKSCLPGTTHG